MQERLQKLIAQAGIASRRQAEELITEGVVTVNGEVITELGTKADPETDHIKVRGKLINLKIANREMVYVLLNKPKGYLSSAADPEGRKLVVDLVHKSHGKLHPVGRLDYNTEGLIILTNDGDFTQMVASSKKIPKVYEVKVKGLPPAAALNKLRRGTVLEDGFKTAPAEIKELRATDNNGWFEVTLHEGHNQQIRKMFDLIGHSVVKLKRISIGGLSDETLPVGAHRLMGPQDIAAVTKPRKVKEVEKKPEKRVGRNAARRDDRKPVEKRARTERPARDEKPSSPRASADSPRGDRPRQRKTYDFRDGDKPRTPGKDSFKRDDFDERPRRRNSDDAPRGFKPRFGRDIVDRFGKDAGKGEREERPRRQSTARPPRAGFKRNDAREEKPARREANDFESRMRSKSAKPAPEREYRESPDERPRRSSRSERDGGFGDKRGSRAPRSDRNERPERSFRSDRPSARPVGGRPKSDRPERPSGDRPERPSGPRPDRNDRPARSLAPSSDRRPTRGSSRSTERGEKRNTGKGGPRRGQR